MKLSPRKMKFFFKKFMDFEERHGSSASVNKVRELALEYVQANEIGAD